jgi:4-amino-4-deoxy-L-arabinose transferase-like glycosyltransferase
MMETAWPERLLQDRRTVWIVGAIVLLVFLVTNLPWQLDDYDQAKQAFTSFEMVKDGQWLYQHTPRERIATKPPLVGWISAGVFEISRSWDLAWRLPSLAAAAALAIVLFRAAHGAYGMAAGLSALAAIGLNLLSPRLATLVRTDMPLALVIFLIGLLIWQKVRNNQPWNGRDRIRMFALLTAGMLIKGPIVYAFLLPGIFCFQWRRRQVGAASAWSGWWPWLASLAVFLLWVIGGMRFVPGFYDQVVVREFMGRFGETIHRPQPFYFYWPHLLHKFAPWSALIILLAIFSVRSERTGFRAAWAKISPDTFWLLCWSLGGLIVMSLIPSKRVDRMFPVVPPLCLLLAAQIGKWPAAAPLRQRASRWAAAALVVAILFTGIYSVYKVASGYREQRDVLVRFGRKVREEANVRHWRYETVPGKDEGMLLYLDKTHFIAPEHAVLEWKAGNIHALVVPAEEGENYRRELETAAISSLQSGERKDERGNYVLLVREKP